ncbi:MAG: TlpA disulfide reductase family protein [Bacteroidia bacterium]
MKILAAVLSFIFISASSYSQEVAEVTFPEFEKQYLLPAHDTLYVLNFWATWCAPCVKELPEFEKVTTEMQDQKVRVVLVSLDFPGQIESRIEPFIKKHNLNSRVIFLNAPGENEWIPKVSESWDGTIPATLFVMPDGSREFVSGSMTYDKINSIIQSKIK